MNPESLPPLFNAAAWLGVFVASYLLVQETNRSIPTRWRMMVGAIGGLAFVALARMAAGDGPLPWYAAVLSLLVLSLVAWAVAMRFAPELVDEPSAEVPHAAGPR